MTQREVYEKVNQQLYDIAMVMIDMYPTELADIFAYLSKYPAIVCDRPSLAHRIDVLHEALTGLKP